DAAVAQHQFEVGLIERALARLVDHRLAGQRVELGNDVVAGLAAHQDAAHRTVRADAGRRIATFDFVGRRVGEVGAVAFAGVNDQHADAPRGTEHVAAWADGRLQPRDIVAQRSAEPAGFEKIALHVDDHQRRFVQIDRKRRGFGQQFYARHRNLLRLHWQNRARWGAAGFVFYGRTGQGFR